MDRIVSVAQAKNQFSDLLNRVIYRNERIIVTKRGRAVGAIVSLDEAERREREKDKERVKQIREIKKRTKKYIPYAQFVREYEKKWGVSLAAMMAEDTGVRD
jgi:prevent-host-death family protein